MPRPGAEQAPPLQFNGWSPQLIMYEFTASQDLIKESPMPLIEGPPIADMSVRRARVEKLTRAA